MKTWGEIKKKKHFQQRKIREETPLIPKKEQNSQKYPECEPRLLWMLWL
jgi:hypothetical protein